MTTALQEKQPRLIEDQNEAFEANLQRSAEEFSLQRQRLMRAGGSLVWRATTDNAGVRTRELISECPDAEINQAFGKAEANIDRLLDQYVSLVEDPSGEA